MKLSNEEILDNAYRFVNHHGNDQNEKQQANGWIRAFYQIFGLDEKQFNGGFEYKVKINGTQKYIDHLLNGKLLIEMKGRDHDLDQAKAFEQANRYVQALPEIDAPQYIMLSNFAEIRLFDLKKATKPQIFQVADLTKACNLGLFNFLSGYQQSIDEQAEDPVNKEAANHIAKIYEALLAENYPEKYASLLMTRIVFAMFADDTEIWRHNQFKDFLINETAPGGTDLLQQLGALFETLDTPEESRFGAKTTVFNQFPYINGKLFSDKLPTNLTLNSKIRTALIEANKLDWSKINPDIFGSMFDGAMNPQERHDLGAHYTSRNNIMKVIRGLFLDDLQAEFEAIKDLKQDRLLHLEKFHQKLVNLKFLDPACGSGNFLMLAYKELRRMEHQLIQEIGKEQEINFKELVKVEVDQFFGIEIQPNAVAIAKVGLWLMDHLMNRRASEIFGARYYRLPLHTGANIVCADALKIDWEEVVPASELDYILGNPPFVGQTIMTYEQKNSLVQFSTIIKKIKKTDYISGWYVKIANFMQSNNLIQASLVSTNSIVQGEQAIIIWNKLFEIGININFAHQTFDWDNNGAHVYSRNIHKKIKYFANRC